ncbi:Nucleoporin AMO1 [Madurella fahalii]|uniref:Nucleoporin AMO1 n=1 Tax=Madurella fahalii TaxID=1157608 RepID=A0ABQ0GK65_9PEZI
MTICRFYQQGNCRYGNACKFEHPPRAGQQGANRFSALAGQTNQGMSGRPGDPPPYAGLTADIIQRELTSELPQWILSCYGPGRDAPEQLFGGYPREQSFEEMRLHWMHGAMQGNQQAALNEAQALYQTARQQIEHTLSNIPAAIQFVVDGINKHPNRLDICKQAGAPGGAANAFQSQPPPSNPFGTPTTPATTSSAFGQPGVLGQKPNPFGAPALGQPAQPSAFGGAAFHRPPQGTSGFGQTSVLGPKPSPFGTPAFGQPAQPAQSAFGQQTQPTLSAFSQPAQPTQSAFSQPSQPAFGQAAALGQKPNPFAPAAAAPQAITDAFGKPTQQASPFAQPASSAPVNNPFGKPAATSSPFTQPAPAVVNPFGQPQQQPAANPFGAPAAAAAAAANNAFTQPAQSSPFTAPATNAFSQPSTSGPAFSGGTTSAPPSSTAKPAGVGPYGPNATREHPDISAYSAREADGRLRMFKGKPVTYETPKGATRPAPFIRNFDGSLVKIWMPDGAPKYTTETEAEPAKYEDPHVLQQWKAFVETGRFAGGIMPEVPPKREFCAWDF